MDSYGNFASFSCSLFFQILYCLKVILNIQNKIFRNFTIFVQFLRSNFQTVYRIDAYDMPLESCWLCATFSYRSFFQKNYSLRADLKKRDSTSEFLVFCTVFGDLFPNHLLKCFKWNCVEKILIRRNFFMLKFFPNSKWFKFNFRNRQKQR